MKLPFETTTLGAFPKPNYVPVRDWFDLKRLAFNLIHTLPRRRSSNIRQE
jgi:hypothetical protein